MKSSANRIRWTQIEALEEEKQQLAVKASEANALATDLQSLKSKVEEVVLSRSS